MDDHRDRSPLLVAWDEAREVLVVALLVAALLHVVAPIIRYLGTDRLQSWWDDLYSALSNINALTGLMLLAAAVAVCTTPAADVVPRLRQSVYWVSGVIAVLGVIAVVNVMLVPTAADAAALRLSVLAWRPGPAIIMSATAAWMARRVVLFG